DGDIVGQGLGLGANWLPLECFAGEWFRWVDNDAVLRLDPGTRGRPGRELELEAEPGPSLGAEPCRLQLLDEAGHELGAVCLTARQTVRLPLPASGPCVSVRLHVRPVGARVPGDDRVMHFRLFHCRLASARVP